MADKYMISINKGSGWIDITTRCESITLSDNLDGLSCELTFTVLNNPKDRFIGNLDIAAGDKVRFVNNAKELFGGIIITVGLDGSITANDFGWYLNKSTIILQCNNISADEAIKKACIKAGVPIGSIVSIPTKIKDSFIAQTPAEIIKSVLEIATAERGVNYIYRIKGNAIYVSEYPKTPMTAKFYLPGGNASGYNIASSLGSVSGSQSIEELYNNIVVYIENDSKVSIVATASDKNSINKYGFLQKSESVDEEHKANARHIANTLLKQSNVVTHEYKIDNCFGCDDVVSGVMLAFNSPSYGVQGKFIVSQVTHTYDPCHMMSLEVLKV